METKEMNNLMIDDLVFYDGKPIKVENVHRNCINFQPDIPYVQEEFWIDLTETKPIPLTEEILKKNGFKLTEIPDEYYNDFEPSRFWEYSTDTKESLNINIKIDENVNTSIDVHNGDGVQMLQYFTDRNILYVHELQHALRLVELNNVADNLIV